MSAFQFAVAGVAYLHLRWSFPLPRPQTWLCNGHRLRRAQPCQSIEDGCANIELDDLMLKPIHSSGEAIAVERRSYTTTPAEQPATKRACFLEPVPSSQ